MLFSKKSPQNSFIYYRSEPPNIKPEPWNNENTFCEFYVFPANTLKMQSTKLESGHYGQVINLKCVGTKIFQKMLPF